MKSYLERQNECGIKVGDKVKVVRKAESYEDGWDNDWTTDMDIAIGKEYTVTSNRNDLGLALDFSPYVNFPYFVLSKVFEKSEQPNSDFEGYDTDYMDATLRESIQLLRDTLDYAKLNSQPPKPASGYTATLTFDLTTEDGAEAWRMHNQVRELHSFAFEVLHNLTKNFERELDAQAEKIIANTITEDVEFAVDVLRRLINELSENYNLNVN